MNISRTTVVHGDRDLLKSDLRAERLLSALGAAPLSTVARLCARLRRRGGPNGQGGRGAMPELPEDRLRRLPVCRETLAELRRSVEAGIPTVVQARRPVDQMRRLLAAHGLSSVAVVAQARGADLMPNLMPGPATAGAVPRAPRSAAVRWRLRDLGRALRPHQWVKNILLLLPVVAAHRFDAAALLPVLLGMVAFSAAASCIYVLNDLLDLDADRQHVTKCNRPFASGAVPLGVGAACALGLGGLAVALAGLLNPAFLLLIGVYMALSLGYSLKLKRMRWIDIATLAALYTLRVVAGALAAQVMTTGYLLVFIYPVFLTLASVKRLTELTLAPSDARLPGRGYARGDRGDLLNVAGLGTVAALVVFFLYSFTDHALSLYPVQWIMWVSLVPIAGWLVRMVWLGYAGKQDHDPIVFAMRDRYGLSMLVFTLTLMFYAAGLIV